MPWIIFGRGEEPAPAIRLPNQAGETIDLSSLHGDAALVIFFPPTGDCSTCAVLIDGLRQRAGNIRLQGAEPVLVLPSANAASAGTEGLTVLVDEQGHLTRKYHQIFEFDTEGMGMLFVLNRYRVPFRAWVDPQPDPDEMLPRLMKYLEAVSLLCPE